MRQRANASTGQSTPEPSSWVTTTKLMTRSCRRFWIFQLVPAFHTIEAAQRAADAVTGRQNVASTPWSVEQL
jgi:hypothetical protein